MPTINAGRLLQVAQKATDLEASVAFYRDVLGGRFIAKFVPPGLAFVDIGGTRVLLDGDAKPCTLYFGVADLEGACRALQGQGVELAGQPHMIHRDEAGNFGAAGEEEWMAFVHDPAGNLIGLVERRKPTA